MGRNEVVNLYGRFHDSDLLVQHPQHKKPLVALA